MYKGWILCKPNFQDSYETNRLIEEFKNHDIDVKIIYPILSFIKFTISSAIFFLVKVSIPSKPGLELTSHIL